MNDVWEHWWRRIRSVVSGLAVVTFCVAGRGSVLMGDGFDFVDLSKDRSKDVVICAGTATSYEGHPTTVLLPGTETILCTWCRPHGGRGGQLARSLDGGRHWERVDHWLPAVAKEHWNCPSIYRIVGPDGKARLFIFSVFKTKYTFENAMPSLVSEDEGRSWRELPPLGPKFECAMSFCSILPLKDGRVMGFFHHTPGGGDGFPLEVLSSVSADGGFHWSDPKIICAVDGKAPCEPFALRSDDGQEICVIMRENSRKGNSLLIRSRDEGKTWTKAVETSGAVTGDRHAGVKLGDGRWVICFRDMARKSPTYTHFMAWVGTYDELVSGKGGQRYKLLHSYAGWDCGYPGVSLLKDGTVVAVTYVKYWNDDRKQSVVACRFKPE